MSMAQIPFAPGESPFHVKGNLYAGTQKFFASQVPGGLEALYKEIDDPALLAFIQQKFLAASWYDVLPVVPLIRAESRTMRLPIAAYLRHRAVFQAKQDIGGVYRFLLKLVSPEKVGLRLPNLLSQIFDFGKNEALSPEKGRIETTLHGYPGVLWEWYSTAFAVYSETALTLAGAKRAAVVARPPENERIEHGVQLVRFRIDCRWE